MRTTSRRSLLRIGVAAGAAIALPGCATVPVRSSPNAAYLKLPLSAQSGCVGLAVTQSKLWRAACEEVVARVSDGAWLKHGDSVFIKVVSNSGNAHPAVTAPEAVVRNVDDQLRNEPRVL